MAQATQAEYVKQLKKQIKQLEEQVDMEQCAKKELEEKCQKLEKEKLALEQDLANSKSGYQKLVLAKAIDLSGQQKKDNLLAINRLIAEIDRCLKLLKESNL